jgi:hypothetical protein
VVRAVIDARRRLSVTVTVSRAEDKLPLGQLASDCRSDSDGTNPPRQRVIVLHYWRVVNQPQPNYDSWSCDSYCNTNLAPYSCPLIKCTDPPTIRLPPY